MEAVYETGGDGMAPDRAKAKYWSERFALAGAAEKGDPNAQVALGIIYANGSGVAQDDARALKWYRLSAGARALREGGGGWE